MIVLTACNKVPLNGNIPFTFTLPDGRTVSSSPDRSAWFEHGGQNGNAVIEIISDGHMVDDAILFSVTFDHNRLFVGREIPIILSSFCLVASSGFGNSTDTFAGKIYLKEKREDGQIVIRAKQVVFDVPAGSYRMNGDLEIPLMHLSNVK